MRKTTIIIFLLAVVFSNDLYSQSSSLERRKGYLKDVLQININQLFRENSRRISVEDSTYAEWLARTGELPPDFSQMRSVPMLPEPLEKVVKGKVSPITTQNEWREKREWIKEEYKKWISGKFPPPPEDYKIDILSDKTQEDGTRLQMIKLRFGPEYKATMTLELIIPKGNGPFPVFMTQWTHRAWAQLAVKRGYIGCVYAASDIKDDTDAYMFLYPDYDFSGLMRRAWGASRVVDYLLTRNEVNKDQISLSGHSRNGKQSLWAAAFDERISAVVSSSSSTGGDAPWRFGDPQYASETLDYVTAWNGHWFHPRLKFFSGREDKLPVDQNLLAALIAPRPLLYHYSIVERGLNSWANEQNYYSVKKVYDFLNVPDKIGVYTRMGEHAVAARDIEQTIDFLDIQFDRIDLEWKNNLYFDYNYDNWVAGKKQTANAAKTIPVVKLKNTYKDTITFNKEKLAIQNSFNWLLGSEPSGARANKVDPASIVRDDWIEKIIPQPKVPGAKAIKLGPYNAMGDHLAGVLYCPVDDEGDIKLRENGKLPVIIYSHQYAYSTGFVKGYDKNGRNGTVGLFTELVKQGFAVLAIDMYGFGTRIEEALNFYKRYPEWSKMGKMIRDVRSTVDAMEDIELIDNQHIYLLGNTIGGSVSLFTAALDSRVAGVAVVAAVSPWRTSNSQYESLRTYSHLHGFMPRLGFFAEDPQRVPVDFGEIISTIAPKPVMIIAPSLDRYTDISAFSDIMKPVRNVYNLYGKGDNLIITHPREINRMTREMYKEVGEFFSNLTKENKKTQ